VTRREQARVRATFGTRGANLPSSFRPRGFSPPRRFAPPCASVQTLASLTTTAPTVRASFSTLPILGFTSFQPSSSRIGPREPIRSLSNFPVVPSCPSKPSPCTRLRRPDKLARRLHLSAAGCCHPHNRSPDCEVHQPPCPLVVHLRTVHGKSPSHFLLKSPTSRPCSVPRSVAVRAVARAPDPLLPWA